MAQQDRKFASTARPKDWVTKGAAYTFTFQAKSDGTQSVPTAATITIKKPGGTALVTPVVDAAVTIAGGGDMTYTLTAANADELAANWTADVSYTVSGVVYRGRFVFDVVLVPIVNVVEHADLLLHHVDLAALFTGGETTTQSYIEKAFIDVATFLDARDIPPNLTLNPDALRPGVEHRALELFFGDKVRTADDMFVLHRDRHAVAYASELLRLGALIIHDADESGTADGGEARSRDTGFRIGH